jgi:predicted nucleic acid-binding protein
VIGLDASVCVKWFKAGERFEAEAQDLRQRLQRQEAEAAACEILSLEVARGLKNAQIKQPSLGITNADIESAFNVVEGMFQTGILLQCPVSEVRIVAKDLEINLGLYVADALHLATAINRRVSHFVTDDQHFLVSGLVNYAAGLGLRIVNLPDLMLALTVRQVPP